MKKNTIAKIAVLATAILTIAVWTYAHAYKLPEPPQFPDANKFSVAEYERVRTNLYDAALDLCMYAKTLEAYDWEEGVDSVTKRVVEEYRVPSLEVLLRAIGEMDEFGGDLADSFDLESSPLGRFDRAFREYENYVNRIEK